jgi:EmrB/QacA subfamily drug resistance transporter
MTQRHKFMILLCAAATCSLIMLDTNIVAVALPTIARDLHAGFGGIQWVISAYLLTFAALLLPSGSLADLHGRRRIVTIGLAIFLVSSAACGLATSVLALEIARAVQGVGGSMLLTSALAIIAATFSGAERVKAYAFWGTAIGVAMALGPIAGGIITGLFGWRWAFLINVPLCVAFLVAVKIYVPESSDPQAKRLDLAGVLTLSIGLFALIWALIDGNQIGWTSAAILTRIGAAIAFLGAFAIVETRQQRPMLDLELFRNRLFLGASCGGIGYGLSAQVMIFFLPIYLQGAFGFTPMAAGFAKLPFAVPLFIAPRLAAAVLHSWSHRAVLTIALGMTAAGNLLLAAVTHFDSYAVVALAMFVGGFGTGILNPETAKAMQAQVPPERAGMSSGIGATVRFASLLFGVAILGAIMAQYKPGFTPGSEHNVAAGFTAVAFVAAIFALAAMTATAILMAPPDTTRLGGTEAHSTTIEAMDAIVGR